MRAGAATIKAVIGVWMRVRYSAEASEVVCGKVSGEAVSLDTAGRAG
jgi:hypothetical protein